ncbi:response regulator [Vulgatibacter sp.]|uniref:response regulator n=1 Tax=Vulgatibacter sp. TaxID=1971226 RepID=UPI0035667110
MQLSEKTILVVEDEADIRDSLVEFLEEEGYRVEAAGDGRAALEKLACIGGPCLVLLDLAMPVMTGAEAWRAMQANPALANIPVIVSTSDPSKAPEGLPILKKPFDLDRLLAALRSAL